MNNKDLKKFYSGISMEPFYKRVKTKTLCHRYNNIAPNLLDKRYSLMKRILGKTKSLFIIEQPFMCDYGNNIKIGEYFYSHHNLLILDYAPVTFGDNVLVGPNCSFYTPIHPLEAELRKQGFIGALPITVGNNVWFGGNVTVLPGVTIGDNCVIGAGSVVKKSLPANTLAYGNPCRIIKQLEPVCD